MVDLRNNVDQADAVESTVRVLSGFNPSEIPEIIAKAYEKITQDNASKRTRSPTQAAVYIAGAKMLLIERLCRAGN